MPGCAFDSAAAPPAPFECIHTGTPTCPWVPRLHPSRLFTVPPPCSVLTRGPCLGRSFTWNSAPPRSFPSPYDFCSNGSSWEKPSLITATSHRGSILQSIMLFLFWSQWGVTAKGLGIPAYWLNGRGSICYRVSTLQTSHLITVHYWPGVRTNHRRNPSSGTASLCRFLSLSFHTCKMGLPLGGQCPVREMGQDRERKDELLRMRCLACSWCLEMEREKKKERGRITIGGWRAQRHQTRSHTSR